MRHPTFFLWLLRLWWNRGRSHQQVLEVLLEEEWEDRVRSVLTTTFRHTLPFLPVTPTLFWLDTMNFSTRCCLILNILEPLLLSNDSSSSITSLGVLILVPRSNSEASGSDSSSATKRGGRAQMWSWCVCVGLTFNYLIPYEGRLRLEIVHFYTQSFLAALIEKKSKLKAQCVKFTGIYWHKTEMKIQMCVF